MWLSGTHNHIMWKKNSLNSMNFKPRLESFKLNRLVTRHIVKKTPFKHLSELSTYNNAIMDN